MPTTIPPALSRDFMCLVGEEHLFKPGEHTTLPGLDLTSQALIWMAHRPDVRHGTDDFHLWVTTLAAQDPCPHCVAGDQPRWRTDAAENFKIDWDEVEAAKDECFDADALALIRDGEDWLNELHDVVSSDRARTLNEYIAKLQAELPATVTDDHIAQMSAYLSGRHPTPPTIIRRQS